MSLTSDSHDRRIINVAQDEDFILIRVTASGEVTSISTMDEEEACDLLRQTADEIEADGFERTPEVRLS